MNMSLWRTRGVIHALFRASDAFTQQHFKSFHNTLSGRMINVIYGYTALT